MEKKTIFISENKGSSETVREKLYKTKKIRG